MADEGKAQKKRLGELREERGISRERLAVDLEVSFSTLTNIETGRNKPRVELAEKIYQYFGMPVGSIEWGRPNGEGAAERPKSDPSLAA